MSVRTIRLLKRAIKLHGPTPEAFVEGGIIRPNIGFRSARTVRRWLAGESAIPKYVADWLAHNFTPPCK